MILLALLALIPLSFLEANGGGDSTGGVVHFSQPAGLYQQAITLRLTADHPDAQIWFTTDGSLPQPGAATLYDSPLHLPAAPAHVVAVRARTVFPDGTMGPIADATYFLGVEAAVPMISLLVDPDDLWDEAKGIMVNPFKHGPEWERPVTMMMWDENGRFTFQIPAGLRIHGLGSRQYEKKSFRLYFREEYGTAWLRYPLFPDSDVTDFKRLVLHAGGQDYPFFKTNGTLLRNRLVANLARQIGIDAGYGRPVILFINGELWGVYNLRERIDENFFESRFGATSATGEMGHWERLEQFIRTQDLSDPANYTHVQTQMDVANFIDYTVMQMITANNDWPQNNIIRYRRAAQGGRWRWGFWDTDYAFGLAPGSSVEEDMVDHVLNEEAWFILLALLENQDFYDLFLIRTADLLNTTFRAENVIAEIDGLATELEADIHWETGRWPGSGDWWASVEQMRDFARRRPDIMRQHVVDGFGLAGTAVYTVNPPSSGGGTVAVNGYQLPERPWQGVYFAGTTVVVTAVPQPGFQFAGWEPTTLPQTAVLTLPVGEDQTITPQFVPAPANTTQPGDVIINAVRRADTIALDGETAVGDWIELIVRRPGGVDLRGWRLTDNDSPTATDEGSIILGQQTALADVAQGTSVWIVVAETAVPAYSFPEDDLNDRDRRLTLYTPNGNLDTTTDPWFNLGRNDTLTLFAPGPTALFNDDIMVDRQE